MDEDKLVERCEDRAVMALDAALDSSLRLSVQEESRHEAFEWAMIAAALRSHAQPK